MFRFKQFSVPNTGAAFKVGTDAVLLGSAVSLTGSERTVLDAGTGSGIIALMVAQRLHDSGARDFMVEGIDISSAAITEASQAFAQSPWPGNLKASLLSLADAAGKYDLIVSNPPYFQNSLPAPDPARCAARHVSEEGLSWKTLKEFAAENLTPNGRLSMILPADEAGKAMEEVGTPSARMILTRRVDIKTGADKPVSRMILEFRRLGALADGETQGPINEVLVIQENGQYTQAYKALTAPFHPE